MPAGPAPVAVATASAAAGHRAVRGTVPHVTLNVPALVRGDVDPATARNVLGVAAASSVRQAAATLRVDLPEGTLNALAIEAA